MEFNLFQDYNKYTEQDQEVWKILYERQEDSLKKLATSDYLQAVDDLGFTSRGIPRFEEIDSYLSNKTGWVIEVVPGLVEQHIFFKLLRQKKFPCSTWLRKMDELDYLEEPDMFHDVFGHVPVLSNPHFSAFTQEIGRLGYKYYDNPRAIELIGRMYWFTIEFGLIREHAELKIYGAGILSSHGETLYSVGEKPVHHEFNIQHIMETDFRIDVFQKEYFVIDSYKQLFESIPEMEDKLLYNLEHMTEIKSAYR
jgi:phenylalanine-4-hydroxylase